jgi:hypothetical protein
MTTTFKCDRCAQTKVKPESCGTGYAEYAGKTVCYACCADIDREYMEAHDKIGLYLVRRGSQWFVTNWPGSMSFPAYVRQGRHNMAGTRYDAWFTDHKGRQWHGVTIGEDSQCCRCRKLKAR